MIGAVKLGLAAAVGYAAGGMLGTSIVGAVSKDASAEVRTGAAWGGRIVVFLVVARVLG